MGAGHGYSVAQSVFQTPRQFLPEQLLSATCEEDVWDSGIVQGIKKSGVGMLVGGGIGCLSSRGWIVVAGAASGGGFGAGMAAQDTLTALKSGCWCEATESKRA